METRSAVPGTSSTVMQTRLPVAHATGPSAKRAEPDLGALQVGEDGDRVPGAVGGLAHHPVGLLVVGVRAVAEVQPGDVHPGLDEAR